MAAVVFDTGAASRGSGNANSNKEKEVRKWFVEHDIMVGVLYLPENLFYNTSAPGIILFLNKFKPSDRKNKLFLVNASKEFAKGDPKNYITEEGIAKIASAFVKWEEIEKFSRIVTKEEIVRNDYNISPSRYIHVSEAEEYRPIAEIVEEEQEGKERAKYGAFLIRDLSFRLTEEFGKGFDERGLRRMRQFYQLFPIRGAVRPELSWTHYRLLIRIEKQDARAWYLNEAADQNWSTRALERQINSLCYERLLMSRDKAPVIEEMREETAALAPMPQDFIKDPYVLEFLGLKDNLNFCESDLEQAIIGKLQAFMLELGKGFTFVARQQCISTETKDFFVDLAFYNYILKCFVLVDLKTGELSHQDI